MRKPSPPRPPIAPAKPERTYDKTTTHRIQLYGGENLYAAIATLPTGMSLNDIVFEMEHDYEDCSCYLSCKTIRPYTMTDDEWLKTLKAHDKAQFAYEERLRTYDQRLADYNLALKSVEEQERALLASLQSKYPSP